LAVMTALSQEHWLAAWTIRALQNPFTNLC
jgi:hypothetical protein